MDEAAIQEFFASLGPVRVTRMFGGQSVAFGERPFALVFDGIIYLKADRTTSRAFAEAGSRQFNYARKGEIVGLGYWSAPLDALDDHDEMRRWAEIALSVARPRKAAAAALSRSGRATRAKPRTGTAPRTPRSRS